MGIERISGAAAMTTSAVGSTSKSVSKVNTDIQVADVASVSSPVKNEDMTVNQSSRDRNPYSGNGQEDDERGQLQGGREADPEKIKSAIKTANMGILKNTQCSFKYHEETNRISITVKDKDTDEVIREIPPEKALDMLAKAWELAGLMVDEKR